MKQTIKIDIVSDIVCPWCYIGKRRLEKAIQTVAEEYNFQIEYHPFELNPLQPVSGVDNKEYLVDKFGSLERYYSLTDHVSGIAVQEGITFNYEAQAVAPNTRKGHALLQLAATDGVQLQLAELLFEAYFTNGVDLSKDENLIALGVKAGLERSKVAGHLADDNSLLQVALAEQRMYKLGISGVPFYIVNEKYGISGAQHPDVFVKVFHDVATQQPSEVRQ